MLLGTLGVEVGDRPLPSTAAPSPASPGDVLTARRRPRLKLHHPSSRGADTFVEADAQVTCALSPAGLRASGAIRTAGTPRTAR